MDSASLQFVAFGLAVALLSNASRSRRWRSAVLFAASLVFLGLLAHSPISLVPLAGFILLGYLGLLLVRHGSPKFVVGSILSIIFVYVWLKKYVFLPQGSFLHFPYFTLGLSYIFFRVLHLLIESGDRSDTQVISPGAYLLYMLNFTTLVSGPIQLYDEFAKDQFAETPIALGPRTIGLQFERIIRGVFKVNVLAMLLHALQQDAVAELISPSADVKYYAAFRLMLIYPAFLYANFSGYIDIVIALARLMRVRLPENFDRPFSASSVMDFWNQWHITLSNWLKTYVYNPLLLALMRRVPSPALQPFLGVFCFFVTFFLIGIWHGRTSEFVFFGLLTGGGMSINKLWQLELTRYLGRKRYKALAQNSAYEAFGRGLNFVWFSFTLFWFWSDWKQIQKISHALSPIAWFMLWAVAWLVVTGVLELWERSRKVLMSFVVGSESVFTSRYALVVYSSVMSLLILIIVALLNQAAPDIVYKTF